MTCRYCPTTFPEAATVPKHPTPGDPLGRTCAGSYGPPAESDEPDTFNYDTEPLDG